MTVTASEHCRIPLAHLEPPFGAVAASMPRSAPAAQICALCGDHCW